jgi:isopenicillin N synthase-like dioxygenase
LPSKAVTAKKRIATRCAAQVEKAVRESGLIEIDRVSIADPATLETTNHAARVFFHLQ